MANTASVQMNVNSIRENLARSLRITEGAEVELHTTSGHVIVGKINRHVWNSTSLIAVSIQQEDTSEDGYERVVLMQHVFEIRPRM